MTLKTTSQQLVTHADVQAAAERIAPMTRRTPLLRVSAAKQAPKSPFGTLSLKLENMQVSGSFKARGAVNKLLSLDQNALQNGIVTASGGNHGLAVAYVGHATHTPTTIYLSTNATPEKAEKVARWGATVRQQGRVWDEANTAALAFADETGAAYLHPFADEAIIAGQGTCALEALTDDPDIDTFVVAVGGGGLISGVGAVAQAHGARVIGVEPVGAPTLTESVKAGEVIELDAIRSRVGTLSPRRSAALNLAHVQATVDAFVLVTDEDMEAAARWLWYEFGVAADLAGAAATAAVLTGKAQTEPDENVCVIVCGAGNDIFSL